LSEQSRDKFDGQVIFGEIDAVLVGIVEIVDHAVDYVSQKQIVVVVEHANVVDNRFCAADLLILNLNGDEEVLDCHV
jgi:hypothetical protein